MARGWDREALRADFLAKRLVTDTGCWVLQGFHPDRYDFIKVGGRNIGVHIVALWIWKDLPAPFNPRVADITMHTCDNPPCWNPDHLVRTSQLANVADAVAKGRRPRRWGVTHCIHGHPLTPENARICGRHRQCRICGRQRRAEYRQRRKLQQEAP